MWFFASDVILQPSSPPLSLGNNPNHQQGSEGPPRCNTSLLSYTSKHKPFSSVTLAVTGMYHTLTNFLNFVHIIPLFLVCMPFLPVHFKWPHLPTPTPRQSSSLHHFLLCVSSHRGTYLSFNTYQWLWNSVHFCLPITHAMLVRRKSNSFLLHLVHMFVEKQVPGKKKKHKWKAYLGHSV